jgi:hypothetical protein
LLLLMASKDVFIMPMASIAASAVLSLLGFGGRGRASVNVTFDQPAAHHAQCSHHHHTGFIGVLDYELCPTRSSLHDAIDSRSMLPSSIFA